MFCFGRLADIDDVIANTAGSFVGYALFRGIISSNVVQKVKDNRRLLASAFLLFGAAIWSVETRHISVGDVILMQFGIQPWIGMNPHIFSAAGFHITTLIGIIVTIIGVWIARNEKADSKKKVVRVIILAGGILILYMCINIARGLMS